MFIRIKSTVISSFVERATAWLQVAMGLIDSLVCFLYFVNRGSDNLLHFLRDTNTISCLLEVRGRMN